MQFPWTHSLRLSLCAAAICALGAVNAQTVPPGSQYVSPATPNAEPSAPNARPAEGQKPRHMQRHHKPNKDGQRGHPGQRGKYATPQEHEAAAARAEARAGRMPESEGMDQYQRNALARCDVFREPQDRRSCVERVGSGQVTGSVKDGGVLREFSEEVPVTERP